jgi:type I restriction enzyme S subunit
LQCIPFEKIGSDVGVPGLNRDIAYGLEIVIPENPEEQKRIAEILSAFDDKIELNNKISRTLEQMAQAIFKGWFIKFNFPVEFEVKSEKLKVKSLGYKESGGKMIDSELGKIPEGWKIGYLGDGVCSEIIKPGIERFNGEKIYLATADVMGTEIVNTSTRITYGNRPIRANSQPILNSIWFAKMINTYKVLFFFEGNKEDIEKYILSTGFMGIKALRNMQYYLYFFINSENFHQIKDTLVQGAVQEAITNANIKEIKILIPPEDLMDKFNEKVESLIVKIYKNKVENQKLAALRDLLLPKLMSGEIKV